jgi:hypothetical protein
VGACPYSDTASDFSATHSLAKSLGEHHEESLHAADAGVWLSPTISTYQVITDRRG